MVTKEQLEKLVGTCVLTERCKYCKSEEFCKTLGLHMYPDKWTNADIDLVLRIANGESKTKE